eukprot:gene15041-18373_t
MVVVLGEFGRSPEKGVSTSGNGNSADGRDHWPYCYTAIVGGAGIKRGYIHGKSDATGSAPAADAARLAALLQEARAKGDTDSPLYQLVQDYPDVQHEKTDVFRERVAYSRQAKERLAKARREGVDAVLTEQARLGDLDNIEAGVLVDLIDNRDQLLSFLDDEISDALSYHLRNNNVLIRHNEEYERIEGLENG